jgi:hypothetical protein
MKFIQYKKILEKNNINLFDHEYRISYFEMQNNHSNNIMKGGGSLYEKLKNMNNNDLLNLVKISISSNPQYLAIFN